VEGDDVGDPISGFYLVEGGDRVPVVAVDDVEFSEELLNVPEPVEDGVRHPIHLGEDIPGRVGVDPLIVDAVYFVIGAEVAPPGEDVDLVPPPR
jgi:hypothetical protein